MVGLESGQGRIQSGPRLCRRTRRRSGGGHRSLEKLLDELAPMEPHIGLGSRAYPHFAQPVTASAHAAPTQVAQSFLSVPKRPTIAPHHHPIPPKTPVQTPHAQVTLPPCSNPYPIRTILPNTPIPTRRPGPLGAFPKSPHVALAQLPLVLSLSKAQRDSLRMKSRHTSRDNRPNTHFQTPRTPSPKFAHLPANTAKTAVKTLPSAPNSAPRPAQCHT